MSALLLPFAKRNGTGELVSPEQVSRGLSCDCSCPGCGRPVLAKQGTEKVWHFAHEKASHCSNGYEVSVHELAKQLLRDQKRLLIPALKAKAEARDAFGQLLTEERQLFGPGMVRLEDCELSRRRELPDDSVTPDVTGHVKDREILIEITVFHRLMPEKEARLRQTGLACLLIDLRQFKTTQATRERLEAALFGDITNRHWLFHPFALAAEQELQAKLSHRIQPSFERKRLEETRQAEQEARRAQQQEAERKAQQQAMEALLATPLAETPAPLVEVEKRQQLYRMQWRACLPDRAQVDAATERFILRTGCAPSLAAQTLGSIQRRSQLAGDTPERLAKQWADALAVTEQETMEFLAEAGFLLSY